MGYSCPFICSIVCYVEYVMQISSNLSSVVNTVELAELQSVCLSDISWLPNVQWPVQAWCLQHSPSAAFDYAIWKLKTLLSLCPETMERTSGRVKGCCQLASQPPPPPPPLYTQSSRCIIGETIINPSGRSSRKLLTILIRFQWRSRILLFSPLLNYFWMLFRT